MQNSLNSVPQNFSGRQIVAKTGIGLLLGTMIAFLLFLVIGFVWSMFTDAIQQSNEFIKPNALLPFILLFIGFIITLIGNMILAGLYNLFYNSIYYDITKMFWLLLVTNAIVLVFFAPIYLLFQTAPETLFFLLGFHVIFSIFVSSNMIEFIANPNFSWSTMIGNILGFALAMLLYAMIYKASNADVAPKTVYLLMLLPSILWFTCMPLSLSIRQKIYYLFYEAGNNIFYLPSLDEVSIENTDKTNPDNEPTNVEIR